MKRMPRLLDWWLLAAFLTLLIAWLAPHQLGVTAYKLSLAALAAVAGYRVDRSLFPYARPDEMALTEIQVAAAFLRRAVIVGAVIIGVCLGA